VPGEKAGYGKDNKVSFWCLEIVCGQTKNEKSPQLERHQKNF